MNPQNKVLVQNIEDIINNEIILRDVPYSRVDGAKETDPASVSEAAKKIVEMLIKIKKIKD